MSNRRLSLHDFKKWFSEQKDLSEFFNISMDKEDPLDKYIGCAARSKVGEEKLLERIETEDDPATLVTEFLDSGGTIMCFEGKKVQIEVDSGTFFIPRFCVKVQKDLPNQSQPGL
jgi:hypothetical protein